MGADRLIYIRTDGNAKIAAGHLVRCLSVAENCLSQGMQVCFLVSDEESKQLLSGFLPADLKNDPHLQIHMLVTAAYDNLEQELSEVIAYIQDTPGAVYLLDSYYVTQHYITILNNYVKTAYLDDLMLFDYPVDLVINYDVIPDDLEAYQKAGKALLGAAYAPLRSQFQSSAITIKESVADILLTTGGSDPYHFCVEFLEAYTKRITAPMTSLSKERNRNSVTAVPFHKPNLPTLHIVIGKLNTDAEILHTLSAQYPFVILHENVTDMATLMRKCDLAVSAAGTTLYELCAVGVPSVSFTMADNQLTCAKAFDTVNAISCAGDVREDINTVVSRIFKFLSQMDDISNRKTAHQTMRSLVDGNGAVRIAEELLQL